MRGGFAKAVGLLLGALVGALVMGVGQSAALSQATGGYWKLTNTSERAACDVTLQSRPWGREVRASAGGLTVTTQGNGGFNPFISSAHDWSPLPQALTPGAVFPIRLSIHVLKMSDKPKPAAPYNWTTWSVRPRALADGRLGGELARGRVDTDLVEDHLTFDNASLPKPYRVPTFRRDGLTVEVSSGSGGECYNSHFYDYSWVDGAAPPVDGTQLRLPVNTALACSESSGYRCTLVIESVDAATGALVGWLDWPALKTRNHITGSYDGMTLRFVEDRAIKAGGGVLGCQYVLTRSAEGFGGTYSQCSQNAKPGRFNLVIPK